MLRTVKKVVLSSLSILTISFIVWTCLLLNPSVVYSNSTIVGQVTIYHNLEIENEVEDVVRGALEIISASEIYTTECKIDFCLNDGSVYPKLNPLKGAAAYAFLNKTVMYASEPDFQSNTATMRWEVNNFELRKFDLTYLIAHEFVHNLQYHLDAGYYNSTTIGKQNWKLEGHADYIARRFKNDGRLKSKIAQYTIEQSLEHQGVPVFLLEDGTIQNLSYYKYALTVQYLMEEQGLSFSELCDYDSDLDRVFLQMTEWANGPNVD